MKNKNTSKAAMRYLSLGLLLVTAAPFICRHLGAADFVQGLFAGIGLALEFIALIKMRNSRRSKQDTVC